MVTHDGDAATERVGSVLDYRMMTCFVLLLFYMQGGKEFIPISDFSKNKTF